MWGMSIDSLVVLTNLLVAVTSILAAAASSHDAVKAMRDTAINSVRAVVQGTTQPPKRRKKKQPKVEADDEDTPDEWGDLVPGSEEDA